MTKEEYQNFALRYKGCGACFPLFEKLTRFEKMWFTAIQKDVIELEEENEKYVEENSKAKELLKKWQQADICDAVVLFADTEEFLKRG